MDLNINFQATSQLGTNVINKREEFQGLLDKITTINTELQSYWQGSDASKYSTKVSEQAQVMQQLSDTIQQIGEYLISVSQAYEQFVNDNASAIN